MSITSRINEMSSHIEQAYDELQGLGADLTNVNKNIENISMVLDDIYDSMPQVSGEGTSLTLDDTRVGKIKSTLKGNTSQTTYNGKNIIKNTGVNQTINGITYVVNNDGSVKVSGTASARSEFYLYNNNTVTLPISSGISYKNTTNAIVILNTNDGYKVFQANGTTSSGSATQITQAYLRIESGTTVNETLYPMISEQGGTYEPYVGGTASPNPSYPQPINVVSGDNKINVCGNNLFNKDNVFVGYLKEDGTLSTDTAYRTSAFMPIRPNTTYYKTSTGSPRTKYFDINKVPLNTTTYWDAPTGGSAGTFTTPNNAYYLRFSFPFTGSSAIDAGTVMVKEGTDTTYEPYQGSNYAINLGVENLLEQNRTTTTINGITFRINEDGSVTCNGTASGNALFDIGRNIGKTFPAGTYTASGIPPAGTTSTYRAELYQNVNGTVSNIRSLYGGSSDTPTFTLSETAEVFYRINIISGYNANNLTFKPMIEKGSKANSYTPYGTIPIELCKIGNYQDYFYKDSDKWYLHKEIGKYNEWASVNARTAYTNTTRFQFILTYPTTSAKRTYLLSNYFGNAINNDDTEHLFVGTGTPNVYDGLNVFISNSRATTSEEAINWLQTNGVAVYYALATPTVEEITDATLKSQLEALRNAESYEGQTNISQVNNDLPFIISASALKEWSV